MKKHNLKKTLVIAVSLLFLLAIITVSCKKKNETNSTSQAYRVTQIFGKNYHTYNNSTNIEKLGYFGHSVKNRILSSTLSSTVNYSSVEMDSLSFDSLVNDLKSNISGSISTMGSSTNLIMLYVNGANYNSNYSTINGISEFAINTSNNWNHKYYSVSNNTSVENTSYRAQCNRYFIWDLQALLCSSFTSGLPAYTTILGIKRHTSTTTQTNTTIDLGTTLLNRNVSYLPNVGGGGNAGCTGMCITNPGTCTGSMDGSTCTSTCGETFIATQSGQSLDFSSGENFKDNFLNNYTIGKKYIDYYYFLSYVGMEFAGSQQFVTPNGMSIIDEYNFAVECNNVANVLQNGNNNDIVITTAFKNDAITFMNNFQTVCSSQAYQAVLQDIKNDLSTYENKTRAQVLSMIQ